LQRLHSLFFCQSYCWHVAGCGISGTFHDGGQVLLGQLFDFYQFEFAAAILFVEELGQPGILSRITHGAAHKIATLEQLIGDVRADVAIGARNQDRGAWSDDGVFGCGHDGLTVGGSLAETTGLCIEEML